MYIRDSYVPVITNWRKKQNKNGKNKYIQKGTAISGAHDDTKRNYQYGIIGG